MGPFTVFPYGMQITNDGPTPLALPFSSRYNRHMQSRETPWFDRSSRYGEPQSLKQALRRAVVLGFLALLAIYAIFQARAVLAGPKIIVEVPTDGMAATTSLIQVSGTVLRAKDTRLNDRPIFIDLEGRFDERLLLAEGLNILTIAATDIRGNDTRTVLQVYRERAPIVSPMNESGATTTAASSSERESIIPSD
jgi:hypothetical protein